MYKEKSWIVDVQIGAKSLTVYVNMLHVVLIEYCANLCNFWRRKLRNKPVFI